MTSKARAIKTLIGVTLIASLNGCIGSLVGIALVQVTELYNCTDAQSALFFTTYSAAMLLFSMLLNTFMGKLGYKNCIYLGIFVALFGFVALAFSSSVIVLWIVGVCAGVSFILSGAIIQQAVTTIWFSGNTATVVGISAIFPALFGTIFATGFTQLMLSVGFRNATLYFTAASCVIMLLCNMFLVSKEPTKYGLEPFNVGGKQKEKKSRYTPEPVQDLAMPLSKLLKMPAIWLILLCPLLVGFTANTANTIGAFVLNSMELDASTIGNLIALRNGITMLIIPIFGILCDRIAPRMTLTLFVVLAAVSCLAVTFMGGMVGAMIFTLFVPFANINSYFGSMIAPRIVGPKRALELIGYCTAASVVSGLVVSPLAAAVAEATGGSYGVWFLICAALNVLLLLAIQILFSKKTAAHIRDVDAAYVAANPTTAE